MKNKILLGIIALFVLISVAGCGTEKEPAVGGQQDQHGCLAAAGYSWCVAKNKCLRVFEEFCADSTTALIADMEKDIGVKFVAKQDGQFNWFFENVDRISQAEISGIGFEAKGIKYADYEKIEKYLNEKLKPDDLNVADGVSGAVRGYVDGYSVCLLEFAYEKMGTNKEGAAEPVADSVDVSLKCGYFNVNDKSMTIVD